MNRKRFMAELERLLWDIPYNERKEAIQYYNDYFDDAGEENEARVIEELGSPEEVARTIREGMSENSSEYTEHGYEDTRFHEQQEMTTGPQTSGSRQSTQKPPKNTNLWKVLSIVLLCILLCPILIPIGAAALVAVLGIFIGIIGAIIGVSAAGAALLIVGIITIGFGIYKIFLVPVVGVALGGIGCLILAVGILLTLLIVWCFLKLIPMCIRGIVSLIRYPLRKAGIVK